MDADVYNVGAFITGGLVLLACWGLCALAYGFPGVMLGWFPGLILGFLLGMTWPFTWLVIAGFAWWLFRK